MKKKITLVLSCLLALLMILSATACGKKEDTTLTLALRAGAYADAVKACIPGFEAKYGVKCEVLELENDDLHTKVALDASNKKGAYDLVMVDGSWMAEYSNNGVLANLSKLGYSFDSDIIPATTQICYKDGDIYLAPYYGNVTVLMYSKDIVGNASLNSIDEMLAVCEKAKADGKTGFIYRGDNGDNITVDFLSILLSYGGWVVDDNNKPTVNTPEFKAAVEAYLKLIGTGAAQSKNELIQSIDGGKGTMAIGWPGWYNGTTGAAVTAITGKASNSSNAYNANVFGGWCIGIAANSQNKDMTLKLLEYLMDKDIQKSTMTINGKAAGVPCRYSCLKDPAILAQYPQYSVVCDALEGCVYRPAMENWYEFSTTLGTELGNIFSGTKTVEKGLADAQKALEALA